MKMMTSAYGAFIEQMFSCVLSFQVSDEIWQIGAKLTSWNEGQPFQ